jgi:hypothetical protein
MGWKRDRVEDAGVDQGRRRLKAIDGPHSNLSSELFH